MDAERPNDRTLIEYIAATVEAMRHDMVMKSELQAFRDETRNEFAAVRAEMATKSELAALRDEMATELAALRSEMKIEFAAIRGEMATKAIMSAGFAAVRAEIEHISLRLDAIDRA